MKCSGSPRISQMPWSGSPACAMADSTNSATPSQTGLTIWAAPWPEVDVDGVEDHPPDVVLVLVPGPVAHPHRPRVPPARQVVEGALGEVLASVDAVHDLQVEVAARPGHRLEHEGEVLERLPVEPEPVQRAQHEGGVADPGVAVVPVARPAGGLGQRGGRRRHDGAGRRVAQSLERQRAALHVAAPRMVGEGAVGEPVPPVADGGRRVALAPRPGCVGWPPDHDSETKARSPLSRVVRP